MTPERTPRQARPGSARANGQGAAVPKIECGLLGEAEPEEPPLPRELEQMGRLMGLCLHALSMAWKHLAHGRQTAGDVRAVAITLFLECSRRGVTPEQLLEGEPF